MSDNDAEEIMNKTSQTGIGDLITPLDLFQMQQALYKQQVAVVRATMRMNPFFAPFV